MRRFLMLGFALAASALTQAPATAPPPKPAGEVRGNAAPGLKPEPAVTAKVDPAAPGAEAKPKSETLYFTINWPSGLSLGEGSLSSTFDGTRYAFAFKAEAAVPGFALVESVDATATPNHCSVEYTKTSERGKRITQEQTVFDASKALATRRTLRIGGTQSDGKSEMKIGSCPRDAVTFLYFLRRELAAGRLPASQPVYYGGPYPTRVQFTGTQSVRAGDEMLEADRLTAVIKSASAEYTVHLLFARDATRTPLLLEIPIPVGKFTVEFSR